jgi:mRNA deadenylase 3'-5' endonuclease subunit Ccr4
MERGIVNVNNAIGPNISFLTWNILSPSAANPSYYPCISEDCLNWENRRSRILAQLMSRAPDVIALQVYEYIMYNLGIRQQ